MAQPKLILENSENCEWEEITLEYFEENPKGENNDADDKSKSPKAERITIYRCIGKKDCGKDKSCKSIKVKENPDVKHYKCECVTKDELYGRGPTHISLKSSKCKWEKTKTKTGFEIECKKTDDCAGEYNHCQIRGVFETKYTGAGEKVEIWVVWCECYV